MIRRIAAKLKLSTSSPRVLESLAQRDFRWYWTGTSVQAFAQGMQFLVLGLLVLDVTGSSAQLGLVLFLYGIPNVSFMLIGGLIADRVNRRLLLIVTQGAVGALILILAFLTISEVIAVWHIYAAAAVLGVVQALNMPARLAMVADLVADRSLLDAVVLINAAIHAGRIGGPAIVGLLIEGWGLGSGLLFNASCYGLSVVCLARISQSQTLITGDSQPWLENIRDGLTYMRNTPVVLTVLVITCAFGGFGMSHLQVIPAFAKDVLGSGAAGTGLLFLASGVGSLIGALALTLLDTSRLYRWLLIFLVLFSLCLTLFAWSNWFWISWGLFLVVGIFSLGTVWPVATTMLQQASPREFRGRVMGVFHLTPGFHYLGAFPLALLAGGLGWSVAISCAAGMALVIALSFGLIRKSGRGLLT